jgi:N-methylhydantoinase A
VLVRGVGRLVKPEQRPQPLAAPDPSVAKGGERQVYFAELEGFAATPVFRREKLVAGNIVVGPAVIEAVDTTVLLHPGQQARTDEWTNLILEPAP